MLTRSNWESLRSTKQALLLTLEGKKKEVESGKLLIQAIEKGAAGSELSGLCPKNRETLSILLSGYRTDRLSLIETRFFSTTSEHCATTSELNGRLDRINLTTRVSEELEVSATELEIIIEILEAQVNHVEKQLDQLLSSYQKIELMVDLRFNSSIQTYEEYQEMYDHS